MFSPFIRWRSARSTSTDLQERWLDTTVSASSLSISSTRRSVPSLKLRTNEKFLILVLTRKPLQQIPIVSGLHVRTARTIQPRLHNHYEVQIYIISFLRSTCSYGFGLWVSPSCLVLPSSTEWSSFSFLPSGIFVLKNPNIWPVLESFVAH